MLLYLLGYASLMMRDPTILQSLLYNLIHNIAYVMTREHARGISLLFLIASVGASSYDNEPRFQVTCDNSSMHLNVEFDYPFYGMIYTSGNLFVPQCSFPSSEVLNSTNLILTLPFSACNFTIDIMNEKRTLISSTVIVQQHRMLKTSYDVLQNVTCEVPVPMDIFRKLHNSNASTAGLQHGPVIETLIETRTGSDLFPNENSEDLYFVVEVNDGGRSKDLLVQNCIAHDEKVITNETILYQMSDKLGCSNSSYVLSNFTVGNATEDKSDLMVYTRMNDLVYNVKGEFFVTCGVVLCETSCPNPCNNEDNSTMYFSDIATKRFAGRLPGATLPPSLNIFESRQTISKRTLRETFSRWFSLGSAINNDESFPEEVTSDDFLISEDDNTTDGALDNAILKEWDDVLDKANLEDLNIVFDNSTLLNESIDVLENSTNFNYWNLLSNSTILNDLLENATLLKDMEVTTSNTLTEELIFVNKTEFASSGDDFEAAKYSIWPTFTVCILFLLLVSCYGGLLYSNTKRNPDWGASKIIQLYTIAH